MNKRNVWQCMVAVSLALGAAAAGADDFRGFYAGAGIGSNTVKVSGGIDDSDTGFKGFIGYSFGELIAVELAYIDGGKATDRQDIGDGFFFPFDSSVRTEFETKTIDLSVVGNLPLTETFSLIGRLGYASIDTDVTVRFDTGDPTFGTFKDSDTDEKVSYGVGAVYNINDNFQLRAEYEGFDVSNGRLDFISLSAAFRFR